MRNSISLSAAALLAFLAVAQTARGTVLPIGGTVSPNPQADPLSGTSLLGATGLENFNVSLNGSTMSGTAQEWVVTNYAGNIFGSTFLTFVFQVSLTSGSSSSGAPAILDLVADDGFLGFATDVGFTDAAGGVAPTTASRSGTGDEVSFNFVGPGPNIGVGQTSDELLINTSATQFASTVISVQGTLAANLSGLGPKAVPEPSSLIACGIAGLGLTAMRRSRSQSRTAV